MLKAEGGRQSRPAPRSPDPSGLRITLTVIAVIAILYFAREIFIPLAFAVVLALVLAPPVGWLQKLHLSRVPAVLIVMSVATVLTCAAGVVIFNQLVGVVNELPRYRGNIDAKIEALRHPAKGPLSQAAENVKQIGKELSTAQEPAAPPAPGERGVRFNPQNPSSANPSGRPVPVEVVGESTSQLQYLRDLIRPFLWPAALVGMILIFTLFLLIQQNDLRNRVFQLAGLERLSMVTDALDDATRRVSRYLMLQLSVNAALAAVSGTVLYFIGLPYAFLWGALAGLLRTIPYVGALTAALLPFSLSLAVFPGWTAAALVLLLFVGLEIITANFLEPWLYGAHTGISALALLVSTIFWTVLWGPAGLILSTPLSVCVVVLGRHVPHLSFLHVLLGDQPELESEAIMYQRLLAMDEQEPRELANRYLESHSLVDFYDSVLIPTLTLAEQDRRKGVLDPMREEFIFITVAELTSDLWEPANATHAPAGGRVLCVPAYDQADEIAAGMLAQLLERSGRDAAAVPLEHSFELMKPRAGDVVCISSLPPLAYSRAKKLGRELRARFPRNQVVLGIWGAPVNPERPPADADKVVTSLAEAVEYLGARSRAESPVAS